MLLFSPDDTELAKDVLTTGAHGLSQALWTPLRKD